MCLWRLHGRWWSRIGLGCIYSPAVGAGGSCKSVGCAYRKTHRKTHRKTAGSGLFNLTTEPDPPHNHPQHNSQSGPGLCRLAGNGISGTGGVRPTDKKKDPQKTKGRDMLHPSKQPPKMTGAIRSAHNTPLTRWPKKPHSPAITATQASLSGCLDKLRHIVCVVSRRGYSCIAIVALAPRVPGTVLINK